jgi:uncharacterized membrane protein
MSPSLRKITYAVTFELGGILVAGLALLAVASTSAPSTFAFSALAATLAMGWSLAFNSLFEAWEARQPVKGRSALRRSLHAILYEAGLVVILMPVTMWWFSVPLLTALSYEAGLILLFLVYTYIFTWGFDRIFGLPASAR